MGSGGGGKSAIEEVGATIADTIVRGANNFLDVGTLGHREEVVAGVKQFVGEATGAGAKRQSDWENRVAADAAAEYNQQVRERQAAAERADIEASRVAGRRSGARGKAGTSLSYQAPNDATDFLGL